MTRAEAVAQIREILVEDFRVPAERVTEGASFRGGLGLDSLDLVDLIYLLGTAFSIPADINAFRELDTVGKVADHVLQVLGSREAT